ncbi:MAG TPA: hypothetical protein VIU29_09205 [Candidatus Deferrimicrobiaceae bacterium]
MNALLESVLTINLVCSTAVFYVAARVYVLPKVGKSSPRSILIPILILHSLRHLGLMFLARGATYPGMPPQFAYPAAIGDLIAAVLAFAAIFAVSGNREGSLFLVWLFNIVGTADLLLAITLATAYGAPAFMGAAYWIPAFWVPALLVTHYVVFAVLLAGRQAQVHEAFRRRIDSSESPRAPRAGAA